MNSTKIFANRNIGRGTIRIQYSPTVLWSQYGVNVESVWNQYGVRY